MFLQVGARNSGYVPQKSAQRDYRPHFFSEHANIVAETVNLVKAIFRISACCKFGITGRAKRHPFRISRREAVPPPNPQTGRVCMKISCKRKTRPNSFARRDVFRRKPE
jgi:hypothetical protein